MNVTMKIDCTPEEARIVLGLPDLQPMQAAVRAGMEERMMAELDRFSPEAIMKSWMSLVPQNAEPMPEAFSRLFQQGFGGGKPPTG
jgi:predicted component of type VI protein secretion system